MHRLKRLLRDRTVILTLGLLVGLAWGRGAHWTEPLTLPVLAAVMTVATMGVGSGSFRSIKRIFCPMLAGIGMTYPVLGGVVLLLNHYLISSSDLRIGFVILAAVPPAVAVIPFSFLLRGDDEFSFLGTLGGYLGALVIMPLIILAFFGTGFVNPARLLVVLVELILAPVVAARMLVGIGWDRWLNPQKGVITNWGFGLLTYTIVGLNRELFLGAPLSLVPTAVVAVASMFLLG